MTRRTARRSVPPRELGRPPDGVPVNVWLYTHTPAGKPYPCRCSPTRVCKTSGAVPWQCPDVGRTDTTHLPSYCCARRGEPQLETVVSYLDDEGSDE